MRLPMLHVQLDTIHGLRIQTTWRDATTLDYFDIGIPLALLVIMLCVK